MVARPHAPESSQKFDGRLAPSESGGEASSHLAGQLNEALSGGGFPGMKSENGLGILGAAMPMVDPRALSGNSMMGAGMAMHAAHSMQLDSALMGSAMMGAPCGILPGGELMGNGAAAMMHQANGYLSHSARPPSSRYV